MLSMSIIAGFETFKNSVRSFGHRSSKNSVIGGRTWRRSAFIIFLLFAALLPAAPADKHLSIYSTAADYSLPIVQRQGHDYVVLLEFLDTVGSVSAKLEGTRCRILYKNILGYFTAKK